MVGIFLLGGGREEGGCGIYHKRVKITTNFHKMILVVNETLSSHLIKLKVHNLHIIKY